MTRVTTSPMKGIAPTAFAATISAIAAKRKV